ncbi:MAG: bifunctional aspartate transaminase/aspartate 4-decarboxylase [Candidatus Saganbacteria bacterium]|nr:bifunctional aspartate transaminase/aspartate 4-decarboxylase [Candidatus Saganbacteria bacterium]
MGRAEEKAYERLSPFELKNKLIDMAQSNHEKLMLNAGRGNPNWIAIEPRHGFFQLGLFALEDSKKNFNRPEFGGVPIQKDIAKRFEEFLGKNSGTPGIAFLTKALAHVKNELKIDADAFVFEMVDAILGDHYPTPPRMLTLSEKIVHEYLKIEMCGGDEKSANLDLFATEGGTAAIQYLFNSLMENHLLHKGDKIAIGTPIFTPYIEIPELNDYEFVEMDCMQDENKDWVYTKESLEKLADPSIKAFFLVNPSNPGSVSMHPDSRAEVAKIVKSRNKEMIIITDDVYGTFVNDYRSLIAVAPYNTILVYSFSKYFGATGWRLGVIAIHQDNIFDKKIAALPEKMKKELYKRYQTVVLDPNKLKLIDRMVADSRAVALNHTAGASTPQQVQMVLNSLFCLIDKKGEYKKAAQSIVAKRFETLYKAVGIKHPQSKYDAHYYTIIDIPILAATRYSKDFSDWLLKNHEPIDFVWRLASEKSIVLMDGGGFDAPKMSVRVSLANLPDDAYAKIGKGISDLLEEYHETWQASKK